MKVSLPSIMSFIITVGIMIAFLSFWLGGSYWYIGFVGVGLIVWMVTTFIHYLKKELPKEADRIWNEYSIREGMIALEDPDNKPDRKRLYDL